MSSALRLVLAATVSFFLLTLPGSPRADEPAAGGAEAKEKAAKGAKKNAGKTILRLEVAPASQIFVDGKSKGTVEAVEVEVKPGHHIARFVHTSGDEHENQIDCKAKQTTTYQWKFDYDQPPAPPGETKTEAAVSTP